MSLLTRLLAPPRLLAMLVLAITIADPAAAQSRGLSIRHGPSERRIALVIGNAAYADGPLKNPVNDARAMARALREVGFDVTLAENQTRSQMRQVIRRFGDSLGEGGVGLFYYAGHAVQVAGQNYLIPLGAEVGSEYEVDDEAVSLGLVLDQMQAATNPLNILILDACRNNPFARSFRSPSQGLASVDAPAGTLIAYATAPGSVASDGSGQNGVYTREILRQMRTPGLSIEDVFKRTRIAVRQATSGEQVPWESSSLVGEFSFLPGGRPMLAAGSPPPEPSSGSRTGATVPVHEGGTLLPASSRVALRLADTVSSRTARVGDLVRMEVVSDVVVGGEVVVRAGAEAIGQVAESRRAGRLGRSGRLTIAPVAVFAVDQQRMGLWATPRRQEGNGRAAETAALVFVAGPLGALVKGGEVTIPAGTELEAFTDAPYHIAPRQRSR
ncbi:MAG TPA: caspase family protein [Longimicrobiaceae bacterium]|nr:caspase family protein [Longimicrobiaceae bacterium]